MAQTLSKRVKNLMGRIFGRLTVISFSGIQNKRYAYWLCKCDCGNETLVRSSHLLGGIIRSCGCLSTELLIKRSITHGMSNTRFYIIHRNMVKRCTDAKDPVYPRYGGRGIKVCDRWLGLQGFINFKADMYESYLKHFKENDGDTTIERILVNGNYEPSNCKWATDIEQNNNRRSSVKTINQKEHNKWKAQIFTALHNVLRRKYPRTSLTEKYIGLTTNELFSYIESQWVEGMSWNNYGIGKDSWNLDHIIGCNQFDLTKEEDRLACWNYKNLKPMWWKEHMKKSKSGVN